METNSLYKCVENSNERLLMAVKDEKILAEGAAKKEIYDKRKRQYKEKALPGQLDGTTEEIKDKDSWNWLKKGTLKKETEGMLMAAQDQALRTNYIKKITDCKDVSPMCRLCGDREETISHIVAECSKLAQKQYRLWHHDRVALMIH